MSELSRDSFEGVSLSYEEHLLMLRRLAIEDADIATRIDVLESFCIWGSAINIFNSVRSKLILATQRREPFEYHAYTYHGKLGLKFSAATAHEAAADTVSAFGLEILPEEPIFNNSGGAESVVADISNYIECNLVILLERLSFAEARVDIEGFDRIIAMMRIERDSVIPLWKAAESKRTAEPIILTPLQQSILKALEFKAMTVKSLAMRVSGGDTKRLYNAGINGSMKVKGLIAHKPGVGYYRPDTPPSGLIVPAK